MTERIANLINALRQELAQYGEMLALLDRQQQQIGTRSAEDVYQSIGPVRQQGLAIQKARTHREECRAQLAQTLQRARDLSLAELIALLPADCRPSLLGLVRQNNELLARLGQRARQNHLRLSRSIELMQSLLSSLFPSRISRIYNGRGAMKFRRCSPRSSYEAFG
ncbi:MAG: flagellar protein FlgN [Verrucomicrobiota bacterium]|jgi:flagellar biosynthesis/type III secretory pathway chaperone